MTSTSLTGQRSQDLYERARKTLVGGVNNTSFIRAPYPTYFAAAEGPYLVDVDGNRYLDFRAGYSSLPFGMAAPGVTEAIARQMRDFIFVTGPHVGAIELAERICARVPSVEKVMFTDSGTKATNFAVRLARLHTGRERFAKFAGAYHGSWDGAMFGMPVRYGGDPMSKDPSPGSPRSAADDIVLLPFNDVDGTVQIIEAAGAELCCVLVEPVIGDGYIPPAPGYLAAIRDVCDRRGILLVFDELITLSLAPGGAQELFGVTPDLTAMGKLIGGGLPIGAVGGRDDVMASADRSRSPVVPAAGATFAGHPLAVAAGVAQLDMLTPAIYERLRTLGDAARTGIADIGRRLGVPLHATGVGQLFGWHWNDEPVRDYAGHARCDHATLGVLTESMLGQGFLCGGLGRCHVTAAMSDDDIADFLSGMERSVESLLADR